MQTIPIIICGAGPVGLSLSLALTKFGIPHKIIEKHPGTAIHPKARGVNVRTMELFRQWGIEPAVRSYELEESARRFLWLDDLFGNIIGEVNLNEIDFIDSPTRSCFVTQDHVEHELAHAVAATPETLYFNHQLTDFSKTPDGINCKILNRQTQQTEEIQCQYLVGADGAHSFVRDKLAIPMEGIDSLGAHLSVYCDVDLEELLADKFGIVSLLTSPEQLGRFIMTVDLKKKWIFAQRLQDPNQKIDDEYCLQLVRDILCRDDLPIKILAQSVWHMAALSAQHYQDERIFLVGDSAHRLPPTGGMGMNTGIQDAHNLAWKLAYVISGYADNDLLDTYESERKPAADYNIEWSCNNAYRITEAFEALFKNDHELFTQKLEEQNRHLNHRGLDLGYCYRSGAIFSNNGEHPDMNPNTYHPSTLPGCRAPHCKIKIDGKVTSTLDLFQKNYTLLLSPNVDRARIMPSLPIPSSYPINTYQVGQDFVPFDKTMQTQYALDSHDAILVRPDGHVAWRSENDKISADL